MYNHLLELNRWEKKKYKYEGLASKTVEVDVDFFHYYA